LHFSAGHRDRFSLAIKVSQHGASGECGKVVVSKE
jgi:hypothetical protein